MSSQTKSDYESYLNELEDCEDILEDAYEEAYSFSIWFDNSVKAGINF